MKTAWLTASTQLDKDAGCNVPSISAAGDQLAHALATSLTPLRIMAATRPHPWDQRDRFLDLHGKTLVQVAHSAAVTPPISPEQLAEPRIAGERWGMIWGQRRLNFSAMTLREYTDAVRADTLRAEGSRAVSPPEMYLFNPVKLPDGSMPPEAEAIFAAVEERKRPASVMIRERETHGLTRMALGGTWSGQGWHEHGDALSLNLAGRKRWFVLKPDVSQRGFELWEQGDSANSTVSWLARVQGLPAFERWEEHLWQCTVGAGQGMWVPQGLRHAVINYGETLAATIQLDGLSETRLHVAARQESAEELRALLELGHPPDVPGENGRTPLMDAARLGLIESALALLEGGAHVDGATERERVTALHLATMNRREEMMVLLLQRGATVDAQTRPGGDETAETPLFIAAKANWLGGVRMLLEAGASANGPKDTPAPLQLAAYRGFEGIAAALIDFGASLASIDPTADDGLTPLHWAAMQGNVGLARLLLARGADVSAWAVDGSQPLHHAANGGHTAVCAALLEAGARRDAAMSGGRRPVDLVPKGASGEDARRLIVDWPPNKSTRKGRARDEL